MVGRPLVAALALALVTTGCIGAVNDDPVESAQTDAPDPEVDLPLLEDGQVHVNVTVPVLLVGFDQEAEEALARDLGDEEVRHVTGDFAQPLPPDPDRSPGEHVNGSSYEMPVVPTARYQVSSVPDRVQANLSERFAQWTATGSVGPAHVLEQVLAEELEGTEHELAPDAPSLVLLNSDGFEDAPSQWRYQFPNGHMEPVDAFGEREPVHVVDVSHRGVGEDDTDDLRETVQTATHYRLLQGSVYPMPTAECHAITLVTAYRPTSVGEVYPGFEDAMEAYNPSVIKRAFENLTGDTVHVDSKVLELPADDPALDALSRGEFATFEAQRAWISMNWDDYWVEHEGCEAYVSFLIMADAGSTPTPVVGIGTFDADRGYRVAMGWINDYVRFTLMDPDSPAYQGGEGLDEFNYLNHLHTHETGHLFGMRHPHDITTDEGYQTNYQHDTIWSSMSYPNAGHVVDFGAVDQANFERNTAGFLVKQALEEDVDDTAAFDEALEHMEAADWDAAIEDLRSVVDETVLADGGGGGGGTLAGQHAVPPAAP